MKVNLTDKEVIGFLIYKCIVKVSAVTIIYFLLSMVFVYVVSNTFIAMWGWVFIAALDMLVVFICTTNIVWFMGYKHKEYVLYDGWLYVINTETEDRFSELMSDKEYKNILDRRED